MSILIDTVPLTPAHERTAVDDNDPLAIIIAIEDDEDAWDFVGLSPTRNRFIADSCRDREI